LALLFGRAQAQRNDFLGVERSPIMLRDDHGEAVPLIDPRGGPVVARRPTSAGPVKPAGRSRSNARSMSSRWRCRSPPLATRRGATLRLAYDRHHPVCLGVSRLVARPASVSARCAPRTRSAAWFGAIRAVRLVHNRRQDGHPALSRLCTLDPCIEAILTADPPPTTAAASFQLLWENLSDLIGTSATATLVRRAAKHAAASDPSLGALVIKKPAFDYEYIVPQHWSDDGADELRLLIHSLQPLLVELTGLIVIQRLRSVPELAVMLLEDDRAS
jgi:hypothetical protein